MSDPPERVLLTGGAGFIGSHVAEALIHGGSRVWIVDDLNDFYDPERKRSNLCELRRLGEYNFTALDIRDRAALRAVFETARPQSIVHLAARAGVRPSLLDPILYEQVNIAGTLHLLELAREFGTGKFIFGSSSSVYGVADHVPFSEATVTLKPISPYASTKLAGEMLCFTYAHLYQLPVVCLRFFTVYGPRQRPDLAIHKFTELIEAGKPIPFYGDGSTGRDYTYVTDIVGGVLAALRYEPAPDIANARFDVFNLGNSHPITLSRLVELLEVATGKKATKQRMPPQLGDVPITWADISKAKRLLGYSPQTSIEAGLNQFVSWYRSRSGSPVKAV